MTEALSLFERLGAYVLTWSWQVAVLVMVAWIAVRFDRRHRPRLRHSLWVSTLLFGLLLPWLPEKIAAQSWTREIRQVLVWGMTITKKIPLADFTPGVYSIQTSYTDAATGERVVSAGQFTVK